MRFKPSYKQLTLDGFGLSLDGLDKGNRWVCINDGCRVMDRFIRRICKVAGLTMVANWRAGLRPACRVVVN